jgi:branched-chain amino acid transport system substrate-binding protein
MDKKSIKGGNMKEKESKKGLSRRTFLKQCGAGTLGLATASMGFPGIVRAAPKEVIIGCVYPLSGPLAREGTYAHNGLMLAVEDINRAGGIKSLSGAKLKLLSGDSVVDPSKGMSETEKAIKAGASVMVGCFVSNITIAATQVAEKYQVPFIVDIAVGDMITERGFKYTFRTNLKTDMHAQQYDEVIAELSKATNTPIKTGVFLHESGLYGQSWKQSLMKHVGKKSSLKIIESIAYPTQTKDMTSEVLKLKALKPDIIVTTNYVQDSILMMRTLYEQKVDCLGIVSPASTGIDDPTFGKSLGKLADYVINCSFWVNWKNPKTVDMIDRYVKRFNEPFRQAAAQAYDATLVAADALERAASTDPKKVRDAIAQTNLSDYRMYGKGPIKFNEQGDNVNALSGTTQWLNGKQQIVIPLDIAETKVIFPVPKWGERKID